jgi:hypothetical protein
MSDSMNLQDLLSDVLVIDWGNGAKFPAYANAASNTRLVGKQVGILLERLKKLKKMSFDKVHCIGQSVQIVLTRCSSLLFRT